MSSRSFRVIIESQWCKACGICAPFCPTKTLEVANGSTAKVVNSNCLGCELCERLCPDLAIRVMESAEEAAV